jgi:OHCU decarboxylase
MQLPYNLAQQSKQEYMQIFENLYEHSPWVAESAYGSVLNSSIYNNLEDFHTLLSGNMLASDGDLQEDLIKLHPMLAGKKAQKNELTEFSTSEQKSAGLNDCSDDEITLFQQLNCQYKDKFGFPFIMAIKEKNKLEIKAGFIERQNNSMEQEKQNALAEINKIAWLRIKEIYGI